MLLHVLIYERNPSSIRRDQAIILWITWIFLIRLLDKLHRIQSDKNNSILLYEACWTVNNTESVFKRCNRRISRVAELFKIRGTCTSPGLRDYTVSLTLSLWIHTNVLLSEICLPQLLFISTLAHILFISLFKCLFKPLETITSSGAGPIPVTW